MNEEQKEENIPATAPSNNDNQNIALHKGWQIKSWQIVLMGGCLNFLSIIYSWSQDANKYEPGTEGDIMSFFVNLFALLVVMFLLLPALLLFIQNKKVKTAGAILSIFFGIIEIIFGIIFIVPSKFIVILPGMLLIFAGIYYFWKKV